MQELEDILKGSFEINMDTGEIKYFLTNTHTVKENHIEDSPRTLETLVMCGSL